MYFDKEEFVREIKDYFEGWYWEILKDIFSPARTVLGKIRLAFSPMLALLWVIAISVTYTPILGLFVLPFFTLHCFKLKRRNLVGGGLFYK